MIAILSASVAACGASMSRLRTVSSPCSHSAWYTGTCSRITHGSRTVPRRLIEFRRGWQASLCQVDLMPGSRGLDPGAWRSLDCALSDQVDELGKGMGTVNRNQAHILRREHEMVMGVFESRQDGQIRGIEDVGTGADQPIQAMGVLRHRYDPFIADGDSLVDRSMLGHGVNSACPDQ